MADLTAEAEYFKAIIDIQQDFFDGICSLNDANGQLSELNEKYAGTIDESLIKEKIANITILGQENGEPTPRKDIWGSDDMWMESQIC